jgi:hypothetical protein
MTTLVAVSTIDIVIVVVAGIIGLVAAGGWMAATRRTRAGEHKLLEELHVAEQELARAHAMDKGWDRALLESAAHDAVVARFGSEPVDALQLVQVIDRPGTDADQAVFRVHTADGGEHRITLGRTGGVWGPA